MTPTQYAQLSNGAVYTAMVLLTCAMVGYALYLSRVAGRAPEPEAAAKARDLASVGAGASATDAESADAETADAKTADEPTVDPPEQREDPPGARKAGRTADLLTQMAAVAATAAVLLRAIEVERWPLGNMYEFALFGSAVVLDVYAIWVARSKARWFGLFVTFPVLISLGMAITVWYTQGSQLVPSLKSVWLAIHVTIATVSMALFTIAFSLGLLYVLKERGLSGRGGAVLARMPSATRLEAMTYSVIVVAFPLWTFTVIAGAIWARQAWGSYWNWDPKEVWSFIIWIVYAAYLHARATAGWSRSRAMVISFVGYGCLILNFAVVNVFFVGQHSYSGL